ncbi:MAG: Crp/Fnr family transcriptional regulator [Alphaproteobacteria bacterium]
MKNPVPATSYPMLRNIALFADLSDSALGDIAERTTWARYDRRQQIVGEGDSTTDVFFVIEGTIEAKSFSAQGKEVTYSETGQGGLFGEFSAIDGEPRSATIIATELSLVARMTAADFLAALLANPELHMRLTELLVMKARAMSRRIFEFSTLAVRNRIHAELLRLAKADAAADNTAVIEPAPTHHELATRVSTHREAVTRELNQLSAKGILKAAKRQILITDVQRLQDLVEEPSFD